MRVPVQLFTPSETLNVKMRVIPLLGDIVFILGQEWIVHEVCHYPELKGQPVDIRLVGRSS